MQGLGSAGNNLTRERNPPMNKLTLLFSLTSLFPFAAQAACNPVTFEGCFCTANDSSGCKPEEPFFPLFKDHKDAEGNYFHMLEGLAIMTLEIQKRLPDFQGFPLSIFLDRQYQDCRQAPGQIYSQDDNFPYMGVCFIFASQEEAESNYKFGVTTYYQYWDLLQKLLKAETQTSCSSAGLFRDGANRGNLWKPQADPKARCKNGTTVLLGEQYNGINQLDLLDKNCNKVASAEYFGLYNNSRPRFCFVNLPGSKFGNDSVYLSFSSELKKVENASNRED
jgi:hypothetical protein